jgi:hypothetical protein
MSPRKYQPLEFLLGRRGRQQRRRGRQVDGLGQSAARYDDACDGGKGRQSSHDNLLSGAHPTLDVMFAG